MFGKEALLADNGFFASRPYVATPQMPINRPKVGSNSKVDVSCWWCTPFFTVKVALVFSAFL